MAAGSSAIKKLLKTAQAGARSVVVILHPTRKELGAGLGLAGGAMQVALQDARVPLVILSAHRNGGESTISTIFHLHARGHAALTMILKCLAEPMLASSSTETPGDCERTLAEVNRASKP
jgi:hypothetical protein